MNGTLPLQYLFWIKFNRISCSVRSILAFLVDHIVISLGYKSVVNIAISV